jgi:CHAT domain-containing protein/predicted negative regulator of RcsB-dependent stress response
MVGLEAASDGEVAALEREVAGVAASIGDANPKGAVTLWAHLARLLQRLQRPRDAERAFARVAEMAKIAGDRIGGALAHHERGIVLRTIGRSGEAFDAFREAERIFRREGKTSNEALSRLHAGGTCVDRGMWREAARDLKRALRLYIDLGGHKVEISEVLNHLASVLHEIGQYEDADRCFESAERVCRQIADPGRTGRLLMYRGYARERRGDLDRALRDYASALDLHGRARDGQMVAALRIRRGTVLVAKGEAKDALPDLDAALAVLRKSGPEDHAADALHSRAEAYLALGRFDEAVLDLEEGLRIVRGVAPPRRVAEFLLNRIENLIELGRFEAALDGATEALAIFEGLGFEREIARALNSRSVALSSLGRFGEALLGFDRGEELHRAAGRREDEDKMALNRASLLNALGRHAEALELFERLIPVFETYRRQDAFRLAVMNSGLALSYLGKAEQALERFDRVAGALLGGGTDTERFMVAANRGHALVEVGRFAEALARIDEAIDLAETLGSELYLARCFGTRGRALGGLGRLDEALAAYGRAVEISESLGDAAGVAASCSNRADTYLARGSPSEALREVERAAEAMGRHLSADVQPLGARSSLAYRENSRPIVEAAMAALRQTSDPAAHLVASAYRIAQVFHGLGMAEILAERGAWAGKDLPEDLRREHAQLLAALRRSTALAQGKASRGSSLAGAREKAESAKKGRAEVMRLEGEIERLEERIRVRDRAYAAVVYPRAASDSEVREALPEGVALLELIEDEEAVGAFLVTRSCLDFLPIGKKEQVAGEVAAVLAALADGKRAGKDADIHRSRTLRALGKRILGPVLARIPPGIKTLLVAPDGELCRVPFEALLVEDPAEGSGPREWAYLVMRLAVAHVHSGTVLREQVLAGNAAPVASKGRFVAFGHPRYRPAASGVGPTLASPFDPKRSGYVSLPGTALEVLRIARLFGDEAEREDLAAAEAALREEAQALGEVSGKRFTVFLGAGATEDALKARREVKEARVLHLACHGRADLEAPGLSHLALTPGSGPDMEDGFVTLREFRDLRIAAHLLVLSACETGSGSLRPFEGVSGLSRAALGAGARSVLSTLWQVGDRTAMEFMETFYRKWVEGGATKTEALALAKRDAIARGLPLRTWSAYILWGAGD